jgi:L-alanine-DL-glutamate epimerase-like enolase superfamily enzyme
MLRSLTAEHQSWPLIAPFRISRGVKTSAEVVVATIREGEVAGHGEAVPYARYGETIESVLEQIRSFSAEIVAGIDRRALLEAMPAGAARNAIDCALWDLSVRRGEPSVAMQLGEGPLPAVTSALTISLDTADAMRAAAKKIADAPLLKAKVDARDPEAQLRAVRAGAPNARLIVDPNESWTLELLREMQPLMMELRVDLVEQPLPADGDEELEGFTPAQPICADESCHVADDIPRLLKRYQAVNIKLDKTGGLTGALALLQRARAAEMRIMCGCMVSTSLSMAPAFHIARHAGFVDLDGPLWLKHDHPGGVRFEAGALQPPAPALWGG